MRISFFKYFFVLIILLMFHLISYREIIECTPNIFINSVMGKI